jgi:sterol desaturase/sphingolipid hydroxylase (fatty acid hydroxylase superfamily)
MNNPEIIQIGLLVYGSFMFFFCLEAITGVFGRIHRPARDIGFTVVGLMAQASIAGGVIGTLAGLVIVKLFPDQSGGLAELSFWMVFPLVFFCNEFLHYWLHRLAHEWRPLWKIHRTHHSAMDMSVGIVFRYNIFWTLLLPQTWISAFCVYMGQAQAALAAIMITFVINLLTHMNFRWDLWLRKSMPATEPFWKVFEKIITLPDTHHAHHGLGKDANVQGNYAITLFIFDTIFGTGKIPNKAQEKIGMANSLKLDWKEELFWPLFRTKQE